MYVRADDRAAGRWPDGTLRFAVEDWFGAGAVLAHLPGHKTSEAQLAVSSFEASRAQLETILAGSISGRELIARGFSADVALAAGYDSSSAVPVAGADGWLTGTRPC